MQILNMRKMKAISTDPDDVAGANQYDLQADVLLIVFRIRKIIILFTFSPVRNSLLQQEWGKKKTTYRSFWTAKHSGRHTHKNNNQEIFKSPKLEK